MARKRRSGGLFADAIRKFVVTLLVCAVGGGVVMGVAGYFIASGGSTLRGVIGGGIAALIMFVGGCAVAWQSALREGILTLLSVASLGHRLLDRLLQVTGLQNSLDQKLSLAELHGKLWSAGPALASETPASSKGGWIGRRLVVGAQAAAAWLVIRLVRRGAAAVADNDGMVSLQSVTTALAETVDDRVGDAIRRRTRALSVLFISVAAAAGALAAWGVGQLPIGADDAATPPAAESSAESPRSSLSH
jgi:hypothetical protein